MARAGERRWNNAPLALGLGWLGGAAVVGWGIAPAAWSQADGLGDARAPISPVSGQLTEAITALPVLPVAWRPDVLAAIGVIACAGAASTLALRLFRGPGRWAAIVLAGPLAAHAIVPIAREAGPAAMLDSLAFAVLSTIALVEVIHPLVKLGAVPTLRLARGLAAAFGCVAIDPWPGLSIAMIVAAACFAPRSRAAWRSLPTMIAASTIPCLGATLLWWANPPSLSFSTEWPAWAELSRSLPPPVLYPSLTLLLLLVAPLRWRGGTIIAAAAALALFGVQGGSHPWLPRPALMVWLSVAATGWVWLAGASLRRYGGVAACGAAIAVLLLTAPPGDASSTPASLSTKRPVRSMLALSSRALLVPGDVLLAHDSVLLADFERASSLEGWRPDTWVLDARQTDDDALASLAVALAESRRRILSDSLDLGGRWDPAWAIDGGPLFWFLFRAHEDADFFELRSLDEGDMFPPSEQARWVRLHLERARHRRITGNPAEAAEALPLPPHLRMKTAQSLRSASGALRPSGGHLELSMGDLEGLSGSALEGAALAEAGDQLYAGGDKTLGEALLTEAAAAGFAPAWNALARWQLEAGEDQAAGRTLAELEKDPKLEAQLLHLMRWLIAKGRLREALGLASRLHTDLSALELGTRLELLRALATTPITQAPEQP